MKIKERLLLLSAKSKLVYLVGIVLEKFVLKPSDYMTIKKNIQWFSDIIALGFNYRISGDAIALEMQQQRVILRRSGSDLQVFKQVFLEDEYGVLIDFLKINGVEIRTIVDAGANIGLTSLLFAKSFPNAAIVSMEPDADNFRLATENLKNYRNVVVIRNALWSQNVELYFDFNFRDGQEWSRAVTSNHNYNGCVKGLDAESLMKLYDLNSIDLLKIDIEGGENVIFTETNDLSFLSCVKVIAIEIHDEFNSRERIYSVLKSRGFLLFNHKELTIGVRR